MNRFALSLASAMAVVALSASAAFAQPDIGGKWNIEQTSLNGTSTSTLSITQSGNTFVGQSSNGNSVTGGFCQQGVTKGCDQANQINGRWRSPKGDTGWVTVYVSPNGHSFNGTWGYNGRSANGSFVGNKILPPIKITTAGSWNVAYAGGNKLFVGPMTCTESGPSSLCKISPGTLDGKWRSSNKVRYKWTTASQNGWFAFWFNDDGQSFNGTWGFGPDTTPVMGRVVGQRNGPPARQ